MNLKDKTVVIDNKTYRYSKIAMLPTNNEDRTQSHIYKFIGEPNMLNNYRQKGELLITASPDKDYKCQHLYFLSSDKIYEGDMVFDSKDNVVRYIKNNSLFDINKDGYCFKIISSTDPSLNLPKPSDSFLQVYIDSYNRNERIEECLVEYDEFISNNGINLNDGYHKGVKTTKGEITIRKVKESWSREEVANILREFGHHINRKYNPVHPVIGEINNWISQNL